jgi:WD40 repeat protein
MNYLNLDVFFETVLPRLLWMTLVSFVIGSAVGAAVGGIAKLIGRIGRLDKDSAQPKRWVIYAAMFGSFIGMLLICMLPILASPGSLMLGRDMYAGHWAMILFMMLSPIGSILGAVVGALLGAKLPARIKQKKWATIVVLLSYVICVVALYLGLAPPPVTISTPQANGPFPVVAEIRGHDATIKDVALSDNGQQLALLTRRYDDEQVEIWDLPTRRVIHTFKRPSNESITLKSILSSVSFSPDGRELITAAALETQVRNLSSGKVRLRLDGGVVAYPMAGNKLVTLAAVDLQAVGPTGEPKTYSFKVWDLGSGKLLQTITADLSPAERTNTNLPIAVSPDQRLLAFSPTMHSHQIQVWDITTGKQVSALASQNPTGILTLAFSPDGKQLAVVPKGGVPLAVWDWQSEKLLKTLDGADRAEQMYWTNQGILVGSNGGFQVWDPQNGEALQKQELQSPAPSPQLPGSSQSSALPLESSALSADRTILAAKTPRGIWVWQVNQSRN